MYRCFLMSSRKILSTEVIDAPDDASALVEAKVRFDAQPGMFTDFEVWLLDRKLTQPAPGETVQGG
jgi:hypothetical protein